MFYRTEDGKGTVHIRFGRKGGPAQCRGPLIIETDDPKIGPYCGRISSKLCDAVVGQDLAGKALTCDMPICERHATHVNGKDIDYCPRHRHLAV